MIFIKLKTSHSVIQCEDLKFEIFSNFDAIVFANWSYLVTEIHASGWVSYLWDVEELEEILHLDGHRAGSWSNQSHNGLLSLQQQAPCLCCTPALALLLFVGHQCVPNELNTLLQRHRRVPAWVPGMERLSPHCCLGKQVGNKRLGVANWMLFFKCMVCASCFWKNHLTNTIFGAVRSLQSKFSQS